MARAQKRDRGRILTDAGYKRIWTAIYEVFPDRQTYASIATWTDPLGDNPNAKTYMTAETISKILNQRQGVELKTLYALFRAFGLTLQESDHILFNEKRQPKSDPNFVGREEAFADLDALIHQGAKVIVIKAAGGVGKTTLARNYLQHRFGWFLEFSIAKETKDISSVEALVEEKLRQLGEEPSQDLIISLDRLKRRLKTDGIGILVDNLETALDANCKLIEGHRGYVELLRVFADSSVKSTTLITSRERLREVAISTEHYLLQGLELDAWKQFFDQREVQSEISYISHIHHAYAGNAKAMELIRSNIVEDYSGSVEAYWNLNKDDLLTEIDLEDLVASQFDRLQEMSITAYNLLVRMGCYRYQDMQVISRKGIICLLWDTQESQGIRVIKSLQDRSLINHKDGYFWLHPVIRAEAIDRLRKSHDWVKANQVAARFWIESVEYVETSEDALMALEAYYHYIHISDFDSAARVLIQQRANRWECGEPLGRSLYRLGFLKKAILATDSIIQNLQVSFTLSRLYNILGDLYWLTGNPQKAIECHGLSGRVGDEALKNKQEEYEYKWLHKLRAFAYFNISLCKLDLLEVEDALLGAEKFRSICENENYKKNFPEGYDLEDLFCYLSFLYAYLGNKEKALVLVETAANNLPSANLDTWAKGYSLLFLGLAYRHLDDLSCARKKYEEAIKYAKETYYLQVEAKALCGLCELDRLEDKLASSISNGLQSVTILEEIGASSDLAESLLQLGLSYFAQNKKEEGKEKLEASRKLFEKINAPRQVHRITATLKKLNFNF